MARILKYTVVLLLLLGLNAAMLGVFVLSPAFHISGPNTPALLDSTEHIKVGLAVNNPDGYEICVPFDS